MDNLNSHNGNTEITSVRAVHKRRMGTARAPFGLVGDEKRFSGQQAVSHDVTPVHPFVVWRDSQKLEIKVPAAILEISSMRTTEGTYT